ncbi:MAG: DUF1592 domain-containing protein [Deltaproteobacteria bacterium]|nr:DUF1592 domain-containing protein [Deltaproteobacteria bacterium]
MQERWSWSVGLLAALGLLLAPSCADTSRSSGDAAADAGTDLGEAPDLVDPRTVALDPPPVPMMARLTRAQYAASVHDVLGADLVVPTALEPDVSDGGFVAIGTSGASVSPRGAEQYETAARSLAAQALTPERRARLVPCQPAATRDDACARAALTPLGRRLWRRPLSETELAPLIAVAGSAAETLGDFHAGLEYAVAALLQSPWFLFRVERGEPDPDAPGLRRRTAFELASRLSFLLWQTTPDDALLDAAASGALDTPEGLALATDRLLGDPRVRDGLRAFFTDYLDLDALDELRKEPTIFVHASPQLGPSAREETLSTLEHLVVDLDADWREAFTSRTTFLDRTLAAVYDVPAPAREGFAETRLPPDGPRMGLLGQVAFLALQSHPTSSSATLRGKFIRERLLCEEVPTPPVNANTGLPEASPESPTLRERAAVHLSDPDCAGCHTYMDPIGLSLEQFDGIGRFRTKEHGALIDASGELDGATFPDAAGLAQALTEHPAFSRCFVLSLYQYALGRFEAPGDEAVIHSLAAWFDHEGRRVLPLLRELVLTPAFRRIAAVEPAPEASP